MTCQTPSWIADKAGWRLAFWYFAYFAFVGAFVPYFTLYLADIGQNPWQIATLMSLPQLMRLTAPPLWGWLAERWRRLAAIVRLSSLLTFCGFALFFVGRDYWLMLAAMAWVWFFWSAALPLVEALTLAHLGGRSERYGHIRLWGSVGFIASVLGLGFALDFFPLIAVLWACLLMLAAVVFAAFLLPAMAVGAASPTGDAGAPHPWSAPVVALLAATFFMAVAHGPLYVFYSLHLAQHGYDKTTIGTLWTTGVIAEIIVFLLMPRIARRFSLRTILLACFVLAIVRFLLIGWFPAWLILLFLAQLLHGATFGAHHAAVVAVLARWFPGPRQARMQGLYGSLSFGAGGLVGGLLSGRCWDTLGPAQTYTLGAAAAAIGAIVLYRYLTTKALAEN